MSCNVNRREIVVKRNITKKMPMMGLLVLLICSLGFISACSQNDANAAKSKYVDDKAMNVIAAGFERRSDVIESNANDDDPHSTENIQEAIEAEIKNDRANFCGVRGRAASAPLAPKAIPPRRGGQGLPLWPRARPA